jgi:hypothetical protein
VNKQPALGAVTERRTFEIHSNRGQAFDIPTPPPPFRVRVTIDPTFVPHDLDARLSDRRQLGAKVSYAFEPATT